MQFTVKDIILYKLYVAIRFQTKKTEALIKLTEKWNLINGFTIGIRKSINIYDPYLVFLYLRNALNFYVKHIFNGGRSLFVNKFIFLHMKYPIYLLQLNQLVSRYKWNAGAISNFYKAFNLNFINKTYGSTFFFFKRILTLIRFFKKKAFLRFLKLSLRKKRLTIKRFPTTVINFHYNKEAIIVDKECARFGIPNIAVTEGYSNPKNITYPILAGISANGQQHGFLINIFIDALLYAFFKRVEKIKNLFKKKRVKIRYVAHRTTLNINGHFNEDRFKSYRSAHRNVYVFFKIYPRFSYKRARVMKIFRITILDEFGERNFLFRKLVGKWNRTTAVGFSDPNSTIELSRRFKKMLKRRFQPKTIREYAQKIEPQFFHDIRKRSRMHPDIPIPKPHKIYYKQFEYLLTDKTPIDLYKPKYRVLKNIRSRVIGVEEF